MVTITCYGGVEEIGGNKIHVQHDHTRIFLDFGMSFNKSGYFYSEFLQPRKCSGLQDFFELGLLPDLKGIYRTDYLTHMGRQEENRQVDAVFLSHAHADHAQYIHFLRKDIPVYGSKESKRILEVLEKTGADQFGEFLTTCDAFTFYQTTKGTLGRVTKKNAEYVQQRPFHEMSEGHPVQINDISVELISVDHSLPGAAGFILSTPTQRLVYTGDIRFHGYHAEKSSHFMEQASSEEVDCLLCEGTRIEKTTVDSEQQVYYRISNLISQTKGLVFVEHPIRDLDRTRTIYQAARKQDRTFAVTLKLAYLVQAFGSDAPFSLDDVVILIPRKTWGLIDNDDLEASVIEKDYAKWERRFINRDNTITAQTLKDHPSDYVVSMNMWEIKQLIDIDPRHAIWIKSTCEPFNEEMEIDEARKQHWLDHFHIEEYHAHASGHASGIELTNLIKQINPKTLIPIHTQQPERFISICEDEGLKTSVIPPKYAEPIIV